MPQTVTYASVKNGQQKNGKLPPKSADKITRNKLCVDLMGAYRICREGKQLLELKAVTTIDPVTGWFEITQYNEKKSDNGHKFSRNDVANKAPPANINRFVTKERNSLVMI